MGDSFTPEELERFLLQLRDQDLEAIGRRLGLDLHGPESRTKFRQELRRDVALQARAKALALTLSASAKCSFCGNDGSKVVESPSGASICTRCLEKMR
ncbi:hypothetical protein [Hydrocarboniclastica marina]|uniref:Uncharacterized protein n=1 Tax=Hydrocarboniclastica marina TaxID=2259620 RepID=A0A4P7XFR0_9ALTE|nr:hypothetical protein [Hydrocarboniclastica marina]QCF25798.1 hypothetical protein soil367_07620 [Hydrocarboniclastica marina]